MLETPSCFSQWCSKTQPRLCPSMKPSWSSLWDFFSIYIAICKIDSQRELALCLRKLKQRLCINLEGWDGEGDGKEVQEGGDICHTYSCWGRQKKTKFCKAIVIQLKNKFIKIFLSNSFCNSYIPHSVIIYLLCMSPFIPSRL